MTKKDYIKLAEAFANNKPRCFEDGVITEAGHVWNALLVDMCKVLQADNPRFDRERFYAACEAEVSK